MEDEESNNEVKLLMDLMIRVTAIENVIRKLGHDNLLSEELVISMTVLQNKIDEINKEL